jgi:tRNA-dihydrouridine synthase B
MAGKMFDETGCDGILVARGALGNPWIFREIDAYLKEGVVLARPDREKVVDLMLRHLDACAGFYGERAGVSIFHKFFSWYTRGLRKVRRLREKAYRAKTKKDMLAAIEACRQSGSLNKTAV